MTSEIVCPVCKGPLAASAADAQCSRCGRLYPSDGASGYDLRCEDLLGPERERWAAAQELGARSYASNPECNCSRGLAGGRYADAFGGFCRLDGRVLDVGCGPYGPYRLAETPAGTTFVGVDPLPATSAAEETYRAIAEYLPFSSGSFDHVIMISSLDHIVDPMLALREADRVLRPGGRLHVWTHLHPGRSRRIRDLATASLRRIGQPRRWRSLVQSALRAARILQRSGNEPDEYHLRLLGPDATRDLMTRAGFQVDRHASIDDHIFFLSGKTVGPSMR